MADTVIDATELRDYFEIKSPDIKDERLTPHIGAASRRLKGWVGAEAYADALLEEPSDPTRQADLKFAEAALAMHFALPGLNTNITTRGVVKTQREGGAPGGGTVFSYLTPIEITQLSRTYLDQAEEIARPYMLSDSTPDAEFEIAEGS